MKKILMICLCLLFVLLAGFGVLILMVKYPVPVRSRPVLQIEDAVVKIEIGREGFYGMEYATFTKDSAEMRSVMDLLGKLKITSKYLAPGHSWEGEHPYFIKIIYANREEAFCAVRDKPHVYQQEAEHMQLLIAKTPSDFWDKLTKIYERNVVRLEG